MWYDFTKRNVGDSGNSIFLTVKKAEKRKFTNFHYNMTEIYFTFERFIVQNSWNKAHYSAMNGAIRWFLCRCRTLVLNLVLFVERFIILDPNRPYTVDYFQMRKTVFSWERVHNSWWGQGKEGRQRKRNILFHVQRILSWRHWSHCSGWFVAGVVCVASVWWASCCRVSGAHCSSWTPWRCSVPWLLRRSCTLRANTHTSTVSCEPVNNRITHITRHGTILMV